MLIDVTWKKKCVHGELPRLFNGLASITREWLSVTSPCRHTVDRITAPWLPSGFPQWLVGSEPVGNTALWPARSPKWMACWWERTSHRRIREHVICTRAKLWVWSFQAWDSRPTWQHLGDGLRVRLPLHSGSGDAPWSWPLWDCSVDSEGHSGPLRGLMFKKDLWKMQKCSSMGENGCVLGGPALLPVFGQSPGKMKEKPESFLLFQNETWKKGTNHPIKAGQRTQWRYRLTPQHEHRHVLKAHSYHVLCVGSIC